jgi:endo-1,4-beta-mannosidase
MKDASTEPFILGVNYWPRRKAMSLWADFDPGEVREELAMIAELGLTHVRIFLLWESFQPRAETVDTGALGRLRTVCDLAAERALRLQPTFFTGHMSGPNWAPDWLLDPGRRLRPGDRQVVSLDRPRGVELAVRNPYTDPVVIAAEDLLLRTVCGELSDHPAIWAWSLGNEPDLVAQPPSSDVGRRWVADRVATIRAAGDRRPVTIGLHAASVHANVGLRIDQLAPVTDLSVMHGYSVYDPLARDPLDPDLVPFMCVLTAALAGRPVLFEEFGINTRLPDGPSHWRDLPTWDGGTRRTFFAAEDEAGAYFAGVLDRLHRVGALGAMAWCFGDYDPRVWDRPPCDLQEHERFFGLYRADGSLKPTGAAVRAFATRRPTVRAPERGVTLPISADEFYAGPERHLPALYEAFGRL